MGWGGKAGGRRSPSQGARVGECAGARDVAAGAGASDAPGEASLRGRARCARRRERWRAGAGRRVGPGRSPAPAHRGAGRRLDGARDERPRRAPRAPSRPPLEARRSRVPRPLPRPFPEDAARGAQCAGPPPRERAQARRVVRRRPGSVLLGVVLRRMEERRAIRWSLALEGSHLAPEYRLATARPAGPGRESVARRMPTSASSRSRLRLTTGVSMGLRHTGRTGARKKAPRARTRSGPRSTGPSRRGAPSRPRPRARRNATPASGPSAPPPLAPRSDPLPSPRSPAAAGSGSPSTPIPVPAARRRTAASRARCARRCRAA